MTWLVAGVLLWSIVHLFPATLPGARRRLVGRLGFNRYRGLFSLLIVAAILAMIFGWQGAEARRVYLPPLSGGYATAFAVLVAFILFIASQVPTNIKRVLRHPQLTGVLIWAVAHLLVNGDSRSLVLFGGLAAWSVASMLASNRRDGPWQRPARVPLGRDLVPVLVGSVAYTIVLYLHPLLFGAVPLVR